jgi:transcriptional regulator with XRE-family HTH domain
MKQSSPLPAKMILAPTLAQRVGQLRDFRNMTLRDLGKLSRLGQLRIEEIEAGMESWLSSTDRQLLAKALSVEPRLLLEVEARPNLEESVAQKLEIESIADAILEGARDLECPECGGTLKCSIQEGYDIDGKPVAFPKAFCTSCPFVLRY